MTVNAYASPARSWRPANQPAARRSAGSAAPADRVVLLCCVLACMFIFRDTMTGSLRFFLSQARLSALWFVPDILTLIVVGLFVRDVVIARRSFFGAVLILNFVGAIAIGVIFMSPGAFALISAIKMFTPIFLGFMFYGRSIVDLRWVRWIIFATMLLSIAGLLLAPYVDYPWVGVAIDNFGQSKNVGRLWWTGGEVRYGGFAGDSTMAAYMCLFPLFLLHRHLKTWVTVALWIPIGAAIEISTSKTAMITAAAYVAYFVATRLVWPAMDAKALARALAKWSFVFVPVPMLLMIGLSGFDLAAVSPALFSMQDRINNTWLFPFSWMAENFPVGLVTGCGLGCFTYPMDYTMRAELSVPVDSFFLATYVMLGAPFLVTIVGMVTSAFKSRDADKLMLIALTNIYCVTVQCYGPTTATMLLGYAFSDMFMTARRNWHRRGAEESLERVKGIEPSS